MEPPIANAPPPIAPPRFELGATLGTGAIATVATVVDHLTGRSFAGKFLHPRHLRDEAARTRFQREAELTARLKHPNLVEVMGTFDIEGRPVLLMELVRGPTLAAFVAQHGPLGEAQVIELGRGIALGLAFAHSSGVIHRDLKPANILLQPEAHGLVPKIADFGMARAASFASADRRALTVLGTPPYMAPECLEPLAVDSRTDLYALGCILYEMATGQPPYRGETPFAVLQAHREAPIPPLPANLSRPTADLVTRLLAKQPADRPQSAAAVVDALRVPGAAALVPRTGDPAATAEGRCAGCGSKVMPELRLCFACGLVQARLEPGPYTVFVTGPGAWSHKLDTARRDRLLAWLDANVAVGFDPRPLQRRIPRLPFPFVSGVDPASAATLVASLERLGVAAETLRGGRWAHPGVRRTAWRLTGRRLSLAGAIGAVPAFLHPLALVATVPVVFGLAAPLCYAASAWEASRAAVGRRRVDPLALPPALRSRIDALYDTIHAIGERRHREALRAVVDRVLWLTRATAAEHRAAIDAEMAHAVHLAAVASRRMDEIERQMAHPAFDPADAHHRGLMHERDTWSARLLDLTATLDALAARHSAASARLGANDLLPALRDRVDSLEEVQRS